MARKIQMFSPRERWVKKVMKILVSVYEFVQVPSASHIKLVHKSPPIVPEDRIHHKNCTVYLPSTYSDRRRGSGGGVKEAIGRITKLLKSYGFDLDTKIGKELALIRMEGLVGSEEEKEWTVLEMLNEITKTVTLSAQVDREIREELRRMADKEGITLGDLIEEMKEVYEKSQ